MNIRYPGIYTRHHLRLRLSSFAASRRFRRLWPAIATCAVVAVVGARLIFSGYAATPSASVEAEGGALASGASIIADSNASGGQAVKFGGSSQSASAFYGINWHPMWINDGGQNAEMDLMQQAGIKTVRIDAEWYFMEQSQGTYHPTYLERMDNAINGLVQRGIEPEIVVTSTPSWVTIPPSGDPDPMHEPPVRGKVNSDCDPTQTICSSYNHAQAYDNFLTFLIGRWKGKVHDYEIWNEPDGGWAWRTTGAFTYPQDYLDRGADYATLLKSAYTAAKAADPSVTVVGGVLSNALQGQQYMLKAIYDNGAKNYFDVYAQHLYCDPPNDNWCNSNRTPYDPQTLADTFATNMSPVMQQYGDSTKPVWVDETGYNSNTAGGGVDETTQASYLTQSFNDDKNLPNVARVYWYDMDESNSGTDPQGYYGIIAADMYNANSLPAGYRLKPAYTALKQLATSP